MYNPLKKMQALGRLKTGERNKTEAAYEKLLELRKQAGEIIWYAFEATKLRLADNTFYSPDFSVLLKNGELEMHEVKGWMTDDAAVKIKVAAALHPYRFMLVRAKLKRDGGGFSVEEV